MIKQDFPVPAEPSDVTLMRSCGFGFASFDDDLAPRGLGAGSDEPLRSLLRLMEESNVLNYLL